MPPTNHTPGTRPRSGEWEGTYTQLNRQSPQQQRLEFADGIIRGTGSDLIGEFTIEGRYAPPPRTRPAAPVLWVILGSGEPPCPWGSMVRLDAARDERSFWDAAPPRRRVP